MGIDPVTMALGAVSLLGTVGQAISGYQSAKYNEAASKQAAKNAELVAQQQADLDREKGKRLIGSQVAAGGASGIVPTEGSPAEVALQSARDSELRALDELFQGKVQATNFKNEANLYKQQATASIFGGLANTGSVLGNIYAGTRKPAPSKSVAGGSANP